ncbi:MAG: hypothetical protein HQ500_02995 [Flavobacteriales bacterium]|nr:hypothetical protein [Flavobacteriales bacterium]
MKGQDGGTTTAKVFWSGEEAKKETLYIPIADSDDGTPDYMAMQRGVEYLAPSGEKETIGVGDADRIEFEYRGEKYVFIVSSYDGKRLIMHAQIDDKLRILEYYYTSRDSDTQIVSTVMSRVLSIEGEDQGKNTKIYMFGFKGAMKEFFSNYPDMVEKVKKKEYTYKNVHEMVAYFNAQHGNSAEH